MNYINIGSTPPEEDCFPAGHPLAQAETRIYAEQLRREFPRAIFHVKGFPHDFGTYHEVVAVLGEGEDSDEAAYEAEGDCSPTWDKLALANLKRLKETHHD